MGQDINMSDDYQEDLDRLDNMLESLLNYGIIHEEVISDIETAVGSIFVKMYSPEALEVSEEYKVEEDNYDDFEDYLYTEYGSRFFLELNSKLNVEQNQQLASIYRDIIFAYIYKDYDTSDEDIIATVVEEL